MSYNFSAQWGRHSHPKVEGNTVAIDAKNQGENNHNGEFYIYPDMAREVLEALGETTHKDSGWRESQHEHYPWVIVDQVTGQKLEGSQSEQGGEKALERYGKDSKNPLYLAHVVKRYTPNKLVKIDSREQSFELEKRGSRVRITAECGEIRTFNKDEALKMADAIKEMYDG